MAPTPRTPQDLPAYLETRLRPSGSRPRLLGIGGPEAIRERLVQTGDLWVADLSRDLDPGPFDGAWWHAGAAGRVAPAVTVLRDRLADAGPLVVILPGEAGGPPDGRRRSGLARKEERVLRRVLRSLSEAGFAVLAERRFANRDGDRTAVVARKDPFVVRSYRSGDERAILDLFPVCFHARRSLEHWRWKYRGNPYGTLKISMAFAPGGELAAHYASYPTPFWIGGPGGGRSLLALQMGDTMTAPEFREVGRGRGGLLPRTVRHFFSIHRDGTYGFFYGFNTGPIQRFCEWFIGGRRIAPVSYWIRGADSGAPGEAAPAKDYRVRRARRTDAGWDRLFRRAAPRYGFLAQRDARWVEWRYLSCPEVDFVVLAASRWGRLVGWSVFRRRDDLLIWGDALFDPRHAGAAEAILGAAVRHPALAGARRLAAWFSPEPRWWSGRLPGLGFRREAEPDGLGMVALEDGDEDAFEKLERLYYTMGDGDLF